MNTGGTLIIIIGKGRNNTLPADMLLELGRNYTVEFEEKQSEITGAWIDEMFQVETEPLPNTQLNIQYGPQKKRGKGKVKKW